MLPGYLEMKNMIKNFRQAVFAGVVGLAMAGFVTNAAAEGERDAVKAECMEQAQENGLEGTELNQFIQECVGSAAGQEEGSQEK
jgi:hypothetical protein